MPPRRKPTLKDGRFWGGFGLGAMVGIVILLVFAAIIAPSSTASAPKAPVEKGKAMTIEEAGKYYTELIKPSNDAISDYQNAGYENDMPAIAKAASSAASEARKAAKAIQAKTWPDSAQKYADATADDLDTEAEYYDRASQAATIDELDSIWGGYQSNGAAASLRKVLGLPAFEQDYPLTVVSGKYGGADDTGYDTGTFSIRNNLSVPIYFVSVTVSFLDKDGNSLGEQYPQSDAVVQPGKSVTLDWLKEISDMKEVASVAITSASYGTNRDDGPSLSTDVEPFAVKIK